MGELDHHRHLLCRLARRGATRVVAQAVSQSRLSSFYEACINIVIGFTINFFANLVLIPYFLHTEVPWVANWWMGCAYTLVSLVRSYVIRRWFNAKLHAAALRMAGEKA
jgi:hypothetical protein